MTQNQLIAIIRIKLPQALSAMTAANLEAHKPKPDLQKLQELFRADDIDGFYDAYELLDAFLKLQNATHRVKQEPTP